MTGPNDARAPSGTDGAQLDAILRTIREVEVSLDRRTARAQGTLLMIWGLAAASIFAFYQLATWNPDVYFAALGGWISWVWIGPMAIAYVASALVGARMGRVGASAEQRRGLRRGLVPGLVISALVTILVLTGRYHFVYGGVTLVAGLACVAYAWRSPASAARATSYVVGGAMVALGLFLLVVPNAAWAPGLAAIAFFVGYLALGSVIYRLGR